MNRYHMDMSQNFETLGNAEKSQDVPLLSAFSAGTIFEIGSNILAK